MHTRYIFLKKDRALNEVVVSLNSKKKVSPYALELFLIYHKNRICLGWAKTVKKFSFMREKEPNELCILLSTVLVRNAIYIYAAFFVLIRPF